MDKEEIINKISNCSNWECYLNYVNSTKTELNGRVERFIGSYIRDEFISYLSDDKTKYIDEEGADLFFPELNKKIEIKYLNDGFLYSPARKNARQHVSMIILKNKHSEKSDSNKLSDCLGVICCEPNCVSFIFYKDLKKFIANFEKSLIEISDNNRISRESRLSIIKNLMPKN